MILDKGVVVMETILALDIGTWTTLVLVGLLTLMIFIWFAVRYWLVNAQNSALRDIKTPTIDRLNTAALEKFDDPEAVARLGMDEPAPEDLLAAVPAEPPESVLEPRHFVPVKKPDSGPQQAPPKAD